MKTTPMMVALMVMCCAGAAVSTTADAERENLLPNADFSKKFDGWVLEDWRDDSLKVLIGHGRLFQIEEEGGIPHVVLACEGGFSAFYGSCSVPCDLGANYVLRFEVKTDLDGSRFGACLGTLGEDKNYLRGTAIKWETMDAGNWEKREVSLSAKEGDAYVFPHFVIKGTSRVLVRNISVEKAP